MKKNYEHIRFFLFINSYSVQKICLYSKELFNDEESIITIERLDSVLNLNCGQHLKSVVFDIKPKSPYQRFPARLKIYLEIEKELEKLKEEKLDEYSTAREDYQHQFLYPAIERATGKSLADISSDRKFQQKLGEKIREYTHAYYKVAYKYKLPTIRIIPFLIRLIS